MVSKATVVCQLCRVRLRSIHARRENASDLHLHMQVQPMQEPTLSAEAIPRVPMNRRVETNWPPGPDEHCLGVVTRLCPAVSLKDPGNRRVET